MYNVIFEQMFIRSVEELRLFVGCRGLPDRVLIWATLNHPIVRRLSAEFIWRVSE
jgi:hypothetical protein